MSLYRFIARAGERGRGEKEEREESGGGDMLENEMEKVSKAV